MQTALSTRVPSLAPSTHNRAARPGSLRVICRPVAIRRGLRVHARGPAVSGGGVLDTHKQMAKPVVLLEPASPAAPTLQQKLADFLRGTAKAAAILGVAVALVSSHAADRAVVPILYRQQGPVWRPTSQPTPLRNCVFEHQACMHAQAALYCSSGCQGVRGNHTK
jgi:hypothetical protein